MSTLSAHSSSRVISAVAAWRRNERAWIIAAAGVWITAVAATALMERLSGTEIPTCLFKRATGVPCPTCGSTRAACAMAEGDVVQALVWNPLFTMAGIAFVGWCLLLCFARFRVRRQWPRVNIGAQVCVLVAAVLMNWAYVIWHGN